MCGDGGKNREWEGECGQNVTSIRGHILMKPKPNMHNNKCILFFIYQAVWSYRKPLWTLRLSCTIKNWTSNLDFTSVKALAGAPWHLAHMLDDLSLAPQTS